MGEVLVLGRFRAIIGPRQGGKCPNRGNRGVEGLWMECGDQRWNGGGGGTWQVGWLEGPWWGHGRHGRRGMVLRQLWRHSSALLATHTY